MSEQTRDDRGVTTARRLCTWLATAAYCIALFLAADLAYSSLFASHQVFRIPDPGYHHTLAPNYDGHDMVRVMYPVRTNSLGFKDATVRDVPLRSQHRRILLIGDSFTEGLGLRFEDTFAGMLYDAGRRRAEPVEFLNAGVASYSPAIYYRKVKALLDRGLQFDEVIVFSDLSDVSDESASYFCIDDDPAYRRHCVPSDAYQNRRSALQRRFAVTDGTIRWFMATLRSRNQRFSNEEMLRRLRDSRLTAWAIHDTVPRFGALTVEDGIKRSRQNMQRLRDMLAGRGIRFSVAVYPWMLQLADDDRDSRQVRLWREFCASRCDRFIDLSPALFAARDADPDWLRTLFLPGDFHFSARGNTVIFQEVARRLDLLP